MATDPRINPTTIFMPGQGFGNYGQQMMDAQGANPERREFLIKNPKYDPNNPYNGEPEMIQDPTATANPTAFSNEAGTRGIMNPFGLQWGGDMSRYAGIVPQGGPPQPPPAAVPAIANAADPSQIAGGEPPSAGGERPPATRDANTSGMEEEFDANGEPIKRAASGGEGGGGEGGVGNVNTQEAPHTGTLTGGGGAPAASTYTINGKQYQMTPNGLVEVATGRGTEGGAAITSGFTGGTPPPGGGAPVDPYQRGVTSASIDPGTGKQRFDPTNPYQFGTEASAQAIANRYGGQTYGLQLQGPGMGFSTPQQQVRFANGQSVNAGLATQALGRPEYGGGAPGSYGDYQVSRDVNQVYGKGDYDQWARSQPGFRMNPRLANTGPGVGNQYAAPPPPPVFNTGQQPPQQNQQYQQPQQYPQYQQPQQNWQQPQYQQPQGGGSGGFGGGGGGYNNNYNFGNYGSGSGGNPQQRQEGMQMSAQPYPYPQNTYGPGRYGDSWGGGGGNTRQQRPQQGGMPGYTAGQPSGQYQPYGGGYQNAQAPKSSKSGGYMQTGMNKF